MAETTTETLTELPGTPVVVERTTTPKPVEATVERTTTSREPPPPPTMDREDWLYLGAMVLIDAGATLFHPGLGLVCVGVMLAFWPIMARICSAGKGPPA